MSADSPRFPEHRLSRSVRAVLLGLTFSAAGLAYAADDTAAGAEVEATRAFDIPAGPLGRALAAAAVQGGLALSFDPALTEGRHSPGMNGRHAPHDAMRRLLAGSGLEMRPRPDGSYTLRKLPAGAQNATVLQEVLVQASRSTGSSEETKSYTVASTSSATKLDLAIKDTPQVVSVITRQRMEDQNLTQVADVMAQAPGVTVQQQGVPGMGQIDYWSRGFPVTNVMFDGVATQAAGNGNFVLWSLLDTAVFDRVELVQGSTGLASGVGDPSASVNFVRKRPTYERQAEVTGSYGSWDRGRATADFSGPLTDSGKLRGRFVAAQQQGGTWQDRVKLRSSTLYGIVEGEPTERLTLTAGATYGDMRADDAAPFGMNPEIARQFKRSHNPSTQWSFAEVELLSPFAKAEWRMTDNWKVNASYMYSEVEQHRLAGTLGQFEYRPDLDRANYSWGRLQNHGDAHNADVSLSGKFRFRGREQDVTLGVAGYRGHIINDSAVTDGSLPNFGPMAGWNSLKISEWNNGNVPFPKSYNGAGPELLPGIPSYVFDVYAYDPLNQNDLRVGANQQRLGDIKPDDRVDEKQYAPYVAARFRPAERLQVILGARQNHWQRKHTYWTLDSNRMLLSGGGEWVWVESGSIPGTTYANYNIKVKGKITPYAGLIFDMTDKVTAYASYTGISRANFSDGGDLNGARGWARDKHGKPLSPIEGNSKEIGVKGAFFDDKLHVQLTGFRMEQKNLPYSDPDGEALYFDPISLAWSGPMRAGAGVVAKGAEINVSGQLTDRFNLAAGYSRLDMDYHAKAGDVRGGAADGSTFEMCEVMVGGSNQGFGRSTGLRRFQCPKHTVKLFGTYQATSKLTVGGGVNWKSKTGSGNNYVVTTTPGGSTDAYIQSAYHVVDLMARYALTPDLTVGAHIGNVFDKAYFTTQDRYSAYYGAPRNFTVSLGYKF